MPYIKKERRIELMQEGAIADSPGELNFIMTMILLEQTRGILKGNIKIENNSYMELSAMLLNPIIDYVDVELKKLDEKHQGSKYTLFNSIVGALMSCITEYTRRLKSQVNKKTMELMSNGVSFAISCFYHCILGPYEDLKISENGDVYDLLEDVLEEGTFDIEEDDLIFMIDTADESLSPSNKVDVKRGNPEDKDVEDKGDFNFGGLI